MSGVQRTRRQAQNIGRKKNSLQITSRPVRDGRGKTMDDPTHIRFLTEQRNTWQ